MKRSIFFGALGVLALALVVTACGPTADKAEFIVNNAAEPQTLDPSLIQGVPEHRIYMALFEGLTIYDPKTSKAIPGIAESWTISEDGTVVTFKLRKSQWSDGTPLTAKHFVDGWIRTLKPETAAEYAYMMYIIKGAEEFNQGKTTDPATVGVKALDDYTLQVTLVGPAAYFVDMTPHYVFSPLPMHVIEKYGDQWVKPGNFVGNGPFVLKEWKPQDYIFVVKNPKYWDAKNVKLNSLKIVAVTDEKTSYNMFLKGEIDWDTQIPTDLIDEVKLQPYYQVNPQLATYYYCFNNQRAPFNNPLVRKALAAAVDKKALVEKVTKGGQIPTDAFTPAMPGFTPQPGVGYDVAKAKEYLAQAGYPDGKGFPVFTILYNTNEGHKKIAEFIQEQWKNNLGITCNLKNEEWKTFLDTRSNSHNFDVARHGWVADYMDPSNFLELFITGGGNNDGLYSNPRFDELVKKAATMPEGAERNNVLMEAEKIFAEDQAMLPLYWYTDLDLIDLSKWDGWYGNPLGVHHWKYISRKK
ncbi:MAG: peptide ABC transporter substrate-binding protein [Breznakiellaceae bacterium]